jgi:Domain of unknown function (DUF4440)/Domain of unknown function (DUF3471)
MLMPDKSIHAPSKVGEEKHVRNPACLLALTMVLGACAARPEPISQDEVVRRTQELFDAVAPGNRAPWQKHFSEDAMYFDEQGHNMDKAALVASIEPLPAGVSGNIHIVRSKFRLVGGTAIHSYDMDESEIVQGQQLHARYHATDTWMERNGNWQIVAGQVLRYYEDPGAGHADVRKFRDYVGTYELSAGDRATVSAEDGKLYLQRGARPKVELIPEATDIFFRKGVEGRRLFRYGGGKVDAMIDRRNNEDIVWKKVE